MKLYHLYVSGILYAELDFDTQPISIQKLDIASGKLLPWETLSEEDNAFYKSFTKIDLLKLSHQMVKSTIINTKAFYAYAKIQAKFLPDAQQHTKLGRSSPLDSNQKTTYLLTLTYGYVKHLINISKYAKNTKKDCNTSLLFCNPFSLCICYLNKYLITHFCSILA